MTYIEQLRRLQDRATDYEVHLQDVVAELCELLAKEADPPLWNEINPLAAPQYEHCESDINEHYLQENERLAKENKDLLHQVAVLTAQERTQRQRGDHWHAKWSSYARIMNAIADSMTSSTQRLHAMFGDDLPWDELLAAAADELERFNAAGDEDGTS